MIDLNKVHKTIWKWLYDGDNKCYRFYALTGEYEANGTIKNDNNALIFAPTTIGKADNVKEYIDGSFVAEYMFTIQQYMAIDIAENDDINLKSMQFFEDFALWVKNNKETLIIDDCTVQEIKLQQGYISGIDRQGTKLVIPIQINIKGE